MSINLTQSTAFATREQAGEISVLTFHTESSFQIPDSILSCNILQFQNILTFGSKLIKLEESLTDDYARRLLFAEYLKVIEQRHSEELSSIEKQSISDMANKISPLVSKIQELEQSYSLKISEMKADYEQQLKAIQKSKAASESELVGSKAEVEASLKKEIKALTKKAADMEAELQIASKSENIIRERCQEEAARHLKVIEESHKDILKMKDECLSQREQKLASREQELHNKVQRTASSVLKGQDGEHYFKNLAKEKMNWELTKAPTFSCDYSATISNMPVLFEIKNYTHPVKSDEVKKFHRDMKLHPEALVGIFISLNTNIQGRDPNVPVAIEWINDSQCVMYFQSCADIDVDYTLSIINQVIRITQTFNGIIQSRSLESNEPIYQSRIEQAKVYLERTVTRGTKLMKKIAADKKQQIELIESNTAYNLSELKYQNADITTTIQILLGEYAEPTIEIEEVSLAELEVKVVDDKPKKATSKKSSGGGGGGKGAKIETKPPTSK